MSRPIISQQSNKIACNHCGYINEHSLIESGHCFQCERCHHTLFSETKNWETRIIALILTGIILFICSNSLPFLGLEAGFQTQSSTLLSGVIALYQVEQYLLSLLVFATIFLFPLIELLILCYVFINKYFNNKPPGISACLYFLSLARAWNMLDIFMVGVLVTSVKLGETATLIPGFGLLAFTLLIITLIVINLQLSSFHLWNWYKPENYFYTTEDDQYHGCLTCNAVISDKVWLQNGYCPRCSHKIEPRSKHSLQKTTALIIAASILYIPALAMPIMTITSFGRTTQDTILSGVIHLFQGGMWFIGLVVFVASILVPILKLLIISYLLKSVYKQQQTHRKVRQKLYKLTEFVGRWSMVDVFVITLLVALVQFGIIMNIRPEPAALAFAAVVVLTMLAAETFDSRLIWDEPKNKTG